MVDDSDSSLTSASFNNAYIALVQQLLAAYNPAAPSMIILWCGPAMWQYCSGASDAAASLSSLATHPCRLPGLQQSARQDERVRESCAQVRRHPHRYIVRVDHRWDGPDVMDFRDGGTHTSAQPYNTQAATWGGVIV